MYKNYWEEFYKDQNKELKPSLFAKYVKSDVLSHHKTLIEFGCGNGRDAIFFANEGLTVHAIDQCENEIKFLSHRYKQLGNIAFQSADFSNLGSNHKFDVVYSRFTLHSVGKEQEEKALIWAFDNLNPNGVLCIEVRGQKNEIYKLGEKVVGEEHAYIYNNHYRRFLNFDRLCDFIESLGFNICFSAEEKGFAPFNGEDETYIRIIAVKQ